MAARLERSVELEECLVGKERNSNRSYSRRFCSRDVRVNRGCALFGPRIERPLARIVHEMAIQAEAFHSVGEGLVPQFWCH